jgi:hypothetical protein
MVRFHAPHQHRLDAHKASGKKKTVSHRSIKLYRCTKPCLPKGSRGFFIGACMHLVIGNSVLSVDYFDGFPNSGQWRFKVLPEFQITRYEDKAWEQGGEVVSRVNYSIVCGWAIAGWMITLAKT